GALNMTVQEIHGSGSRLLLAVGVIDQQCGLVIAGPLKPGRGSRAPQEGRNRAQVSDDRHQESSSSAEAVSRQSSLLSSSSSVEFANTAAACFFVALAPSCLRCSTRPRRLPRPVLSLLCALSKHFCVALSLAPISSRSATKATNLSYIWPALLAIS